MIRKQTVSLILAAMLGLTLLVSHATGWMNAGSLGPGVTSGEVVTNPSGGGNTGG